MAAKPPVRISQKIIIPLSIIMIAAAVFAFIDSSHRIEKRKLAPLFSTSRLPVSHLPMIQWLNNRAVTM